MNSSTTFHIDQLFKQLKNVLWPESNQAWLPIKEISMLNSFLPTTLHTKVFILILDKIYPQISPHSNIFLLQKSTKLM